MFEILRHYGIPDKLVRAIKTIYNNSKSAVLVEGGLTEEFEITTGVLQGDTLAPFLFIIVIDYVLKNAELNHATIHGINEGENGFVTQPRQCRRQPVTAIFDLDFADDLALLEGNLERAQSQLNEIAKQAEQVGLVVNVKKTEAFTNQDKSKNLELGNQKIEWVNNFKYLGSMVKSSETDISVIALADAAEDNRERLIQAFTRLRSATHLLILLLSLWQGLSSEQTAILEATLLPLLQDTPQLGWEESVDAAVSHLLKTCLSRSPKDQAISLSTGPLTIPKDTSRLKKHITLLCDRLGKGGRLSLSSEANVPTTVMMPVSCESIPEPIVEQEEEPPLQQDVAKYIKKKQPSKRIKSKSDSSKESSREKKEKDSGKEESKSKKESKRESTKESKEPSKDKESTKEKESSKESGKEKTKVSRKSSVKVKEKKSEAGDG
ncbi:PTHB1 isoform X1 [Labeo rohita]|nr:PTHB1 isoform X1 [Labeo rohita]